VRDEWEKAIAERREFNLEYRLLTPTGDVRWVLVHCLRLSPETVESTGLLGTVFDLSERKRLEQQLREQYEQLQQLDRLKTSFVDAVSHEIRTPLSSIMGYAEFLADGLGGPLTAQQAEYVLQLTDGARRLEYLVNDLLDFARIEAGTFHLSVQTTDLVPRIHAVVESLQPQFRSVGHTLELELPETLVLTMDSQRIGQVLSNLLSNAVKFTPPGGRIRVSAGVDGDWAWCEVVDNGEGIDPEDQPRLFQRFTQLSAGLRKARGTGLGLSISKAFIEAHGGQIGVESERGRGSRFWFRLPLRSSLEPAPIVREPGPSS